MWERLRRFKALDPESRNLFLRALVLVPLISVSLKLRGFRATQTALHHRLASGSQRFPEGASRGNLSSTTTAAERSRLTARMVNAVTRHFWRGSTCLEKSLALWWLLARQGIASHLRIGARKIDGKFEAHAWIDRHGVAVGEPEDVHQHYAVFDEALSSASWEPQ